MRRWPARLFRIVPASSPAESSIMATQVFNLVGRGVFSLSEASRLTGIPAPRIRRWLTVYEFRSRLGPRYSPPPVQRDYAVADGKVSLSFADMIEVRFLDHFLEAGVSWA